MKRKKETSRPKPEVLKAAKVKKTISNERVDEMVKEISVLTYGQCLMIKKAVSQRIGQTR